ncbi:predicted protein [Uncinocarpus reesii 1704]|uniref:Dopa 4,5-dioxygenase n=1 Tax=Uncinocarpus reesii (strain UAMH 1704) TaxID=336963 RepID=C4JE06_UNCRE|nr:uncharacterized protein UREG_00430 [Uncinocarpus reesii 1704]EEP75584.1 predicted protein [Uncinocarpus reesii 1704]
MDEMDEADEMEERGTARRYNDTPRQETDISIKLPQLAPSRHPLIHQFRSGLNTITVSAPAYGVLPLYYSLLSLIAQNRNAGSVFVPIPLATRGVRQSPAALQPSKGVRAYDTFQAPLDDRDDVVGFDVHIYHYQNNPEQVEFAKALWERIRREFPELRIYDFFDRPLGPHPVAMFEVNIFTPSQFGAFIPWLVINRGPLSVLIHPNTIDEEEERNHTQRATWMGERIPLDLRVFKLMRHE